jgi:hypothetical protein
MKTPRTITEARKMGYVVKKVLEGYDKYRVDMVPRFYREDMKAIVSFYITYKGAKRLRIQTF